MSVNKMLEKFHNEDIFISDSDERLLSIPKGSELSYKFDKELLIGEIILLDWLEFKPVNKIPPDYFNNWYSINTYNSIKKLNRKKYIELGSSIDSLKSLKVNELKEILRLNDLKISGNKLELIKRIQKELPENIFKPYVSDTWIITNKGKEFLKKYHLIIWSHKNRSPGYDLDITPGNLAPYVNLKMAPELISIHFLNKAIQKRITELHLNKEYFGDTYLITSNFIFLSHLYKNLNYQGSALNSLILAIMFGLIGHESLGNYLNSGHSFNDVYNSIFFHRKRIQKEIVTLQFEHHISEDLLIDQASIIFNEHQHRLPEKKLYKDKIEFLEAFEIIISGTEDDYKKLILNWLTRENNLKLL